MGWADNYIKQLQSGKTISFRPRGTSMTGKVEDGQLCTVAPLSNVYEIRIGDVVLCKVAGHQYLHLIKSISGDRVQIGNNRGHINGWTNRSNVYGRLIELDSKPIAR